jgi:hypothetical protein
VALIGVYRSGKTGQPVSSAKWGYALLWAAVIGARAIFSYGADHWCNSQLGGWLAANRIPSAAITDGLIFMALTMIIIRTGSLFIRSRSLQPVGRLVEDRDAGIAQQGGRDARPQAHARENLSNQGPCRSVIS